MKRPNIDWGPIDAKDEPDYSFLEKFVKSSSYDEVIEHYHPLISGEKGSGKSAFKRHLVSMHKKQEDVVEEISFDEIEYASIIENLNHLIDYTAQKSLSVLSHYWQFIIFIYSMRISMDMEKTHLTKEKNIIQEYLIESGFSEMGIVSMMSALTVNAIKKIEEATNPQDKEELKRLGLPSSLNKQIYETIKNYPLFDPKFVRAQNAFVKFLRNGERKCVVTLDDFDEIKARSFEDREKIQAIFDSLMSAIYKISTNNELREHLRIYCFIPHDRFIAADLRDDDKIGYKHEAIGWGYKDLKNLLNRRIHYSTKGKGFDELWNELFPTHIQNECYDVREHSFDFLLRHTQYRPRQLLRTLEALEIPARSNNFDQKKFREIVHTMAKKNVDSFIKEYAIDHPRLKQFFHRFKNFNNVCEYTDFRKRVEKIVAEYGALVSLDEKINQLYNIGFFGIMKCLKKHEILELSDNYYIPPTTYRGQKYLCKFYYHFPDESISHALQGEDIVVLHPMFFDYCEQAHDESLIIG